MNIRSRLPISILSLLVLLATIGCSLIDAHRAIYGRWRAEQLSFAGISIPLAPSMEFERDKAVIGDAPTVIESYARDGDRITVHLKGGPSLTFLMQGSDAMTIDVPLFGKMRYTRVK